MRLLLDEHYSLEIALTLRDRGHDVTAALEAGLSGCSDEDLLAAAAGELRALLTNNARHFVPLARRWAAAGRQHYGLLFTSDESMPRSKGTIGRYVDTLEALLREHPDDAALVDQARWLGG
ncbi:MAG: DUF5615 family PIN-like protein [Solirubrobacterales bacterium]